MHPEWSSSGLCVTADLERQHRQLTATLAEVQRDVGIGRFEEAQGRFAAFEGLFLRHLAAEERVLFPVFEAVTDVGEGPTKALRCAHCGFRKVVTGIARSLVMEHREEAVAMLECLADALVAHDAQEEEWLYPVCNNAVRDEIVRTVILQRIDECLTSPSDAIPAGPPHVCSGGAAADESPPGE